MATKEGSDSDSVVLFPQAKGDFGLRMNYALNSKGILISVHSFKGNCKTTRINISPFLQSRGPCPYEAHRLRPRVLEPTA